MPTIDMRHLCIHNDAIAKISGVPAFAGTTIPGDDMTRTYRPGEAGPRSSQRMATAANRAMAN
ncbi:hypothetical protein GCM10023307_30860 [Lysobacter hankyongensis]|uniref:Uncharacterized protein n=1 Tax=Lysobacter hankyongensis TaxID=1176535 RepID=A0ABP9BXN9_9GAMM